MSSSTRSPSPPSDHDSDVSDDCDYSSDCEYDKDPSPCLLWSLVRCGLSVESAELKILSGEGDRHIYGDVHINGGSYGKAYVIYHRKSDEPEVVSSASGGHLTLCGPRYFVSLSGRRPDILYVNLHEGGAPFLQQRLRLDLSSLQTNRTIPVTVIGDKGILTMYVTWVSPSILSRVSVDLVNVNVTSSEQSQWMVSGTIAAIQMLTGGQKRVLNLFHGDPLPLAPSFSITLHRRVILAPVHLEDHIVRMANDLIIGQGSMSPFVDPLHLNGVGSSLSFAVDLKFVDAADHNICCHIKDAKTFELKGSHELGQLYFEYMEGVIKPHKRKLDSMVRWSKGSPSDDKLKIKVMIETFTDMIMHIPDEVFQDKLPLYTGPLTP